ncbi:DUF1161 domain-containing protein [Rhodanobacter sp. AS-Z3]|uniref:DUF1161 domain-containing protein n=1 Tax=Rhodanobacter sp. AS-Z3 TaxID=3031330 RepID=UPI002478A7A8|nr:DUF1161 domain-containing protein [Rhodanobacter sp. AS-Z3]WEN15071.1 DUF1161 domain-containing protein [Rhodanobacter sp. AS-Z3]
MNTRFGMTALLLLALPVLAHASCDSAKASIDAKIKANGVSSFTLSVVDAGKGAADGKVVGQCEGSKEIVYQRGTAAAPAEKAASPAEPAPASSSAG